MTLDEPNGLTNTHINRVELLPTVADVAREFPLTPAARAAVALGRSDVRAILRGIDSRRMLMVGPCSIHDPKEALDYARYVRALQSEARGTHLLVMRAYLEKPRTELGWTGFVPDPHLNETHDVAYGRREARKLLLGIAELGVPVMTEVLDRSHIQFYDHLVTLAAIGARTTQYPNMRHMASGLSMPVGIKNTTGGGVEDAIGAIVTAYERQGFIGVTKEEGREARFITDGNPDCFCILRGGARPNYDAESVAKTLRKIDAANEQRPSGSRLVDRLVVDCSHANSLVPAIHRGGKEGMVKDYGRQVNVALDVGRQMNANPRVAGLMLESYFTAGSHALPKNLKGFDRSTLPIGLSVTDACLDQRTTTELVRELHRTATYGR